MARKFLQRLLVISFVIFGPVVVTGSASPSIAIVRPDVIRVGGPSEPTDTKIAVVASTTARPGQSFDVLDANNTVVLTKLLVKKSGAAPWRYVYWADFSSITTPGTYRIRVGTMVSNPWVIGMNVGRDAIPTMLQFFNANRDGSESSTLHNPSHLNDATVSGGPYNGQHFDLAGGWMDAGDMIHFTETTSYAAVVLQLAAAKDPIDANALNDEADVGIRWLMKAHPAAGLFIGQVGDDRDHDQGFRDPATDDASAAPGIGTRIAYPSTGSSLSGKTAAALALAAERATGAARTALITQAQQWYASGVATAGIGPVLRGGFYRASTWHDDLALAGVMLYRVTGTDAYLSDAVAHLQAASVQDTIGWDDVGALAGADLCGGLTHPPVADVTALALGCAKVHDVAVAALGYANHGPWGVAGYYAWGSTAVNSGNAAAIALDVEAGQTASAAAAQRARDYLVGNNQFGTSFIVGYGQASPMHPHHWGSVFGIAQPIGAVVGGPAPKAQIRAQGFVVANPFSTAAVAYEDNINDYVTSEPALDYTANSILLESLL